VHLGDNSIVKAIGMGFIVVEVIVKGKTKKLRLKDVFYMPKFQANLFLVRELLLRGLKVQFICNECIFQEEVLAMAFCKHKMY